MFTFTIPDFMKDMGEEFFEFILNYTGEPLNFAREKAIKVNEIQLNILNALYKICKERREINIETKIIDLEFDLGIHTVMGKKFNRHIFNSWRMSAGGEFYIPKDINNDLELELAKIALEAYPLFLRKPFCTPPHVFYSGEQLIDTLCTEHPRPILKSKLLKLFISDPSISKIIDKNIEFIKTYKSRSGNGHKMPLSSLPRLLITNAYALMFIRGDVSEETLVKILIEVINYLRDACDGKPIKLPLFIGFNNIVLPEDCLPIKIKNGIMRKYSNHVIQILPKYFDNNGNGLNGFVLETTYSYKIMYGVEENHNSFESSDLEKQLNDIQDKVCFAINASMKNLPHTGAKPSWMKPTDVLNNGIINFSRYINFNILRSTPTLNKEETLKFKKYIDKLQELSSDQYSQLEIAIRRVNSALCERVKPIDRLTDAIIGWDSLFGTDKQIGENISKAISKILDNHSKAELKQYYKYRSKILHGNQLAKWINQSGMKKIHYNQNKSYEECISILIKSIEYLLWGHPELITKPNRSNTINKDSYKKSNYII